MEYGATYRCFQRWQQNCGNGALEPGEQCDGSEFDGATCRDHFPERFPVTDDDRSPTCLEDCRVSCGLCGDGVVDPELGEQCDEGAANSDAPGASCRTDCQPQRCGDGIVDEPRGEECDTDGAMQVSCVSLGYHVGTVTGCIDCRYNRASCSGYCGDGVVNGTEECDGIDTGGQDCVSTGATAGRLRCDLGCRLSRASCTGTVFTEAHLSPGITLSELWVSASGTLFAARSDGSVLRNVGGQWIVDAVDSGPLTSVWGRNDTEVWVAGPAGLHRFDGAAWSLVHAGSYTRVFGAGTSTLFGYYGGTGELWRYHNDSWALLRSGMLGMNEGAWAASPDIVYLAEMGEMFRYDGQQWTSLGLSNGPSVEGIWGFGADDVYFAAAQSVMHFDGQSLSTFHAMVDPTFWFSTVWGTSPASLYAGGQTGLIEHFDGQQWAEVDLGQRQPDLNIVSIGGSSPEDIWIGANTPLGAYTDGVLYHLDARAFWQTVPSGTTSGLLAVWGANASDVWVTGEHGTVLRFDGSDWTPDGPGTTESLLAISGVTGEAVYVASSNSVWRREPAGGWSALPPPPEAISAILGEAGGVLYAAGERRVFRLQNGSWSVFFSATDQQTNLIFQPKSLWRASDGALYVGGDQLECVDGWCKILGGSLWRLAGPGNATQMCIENAEGSYVAVGGAQPGDLFLLAVSELGLGQLQRYGGSCIDAVDALDFGMRDLAFVSSTNVYAVGQLGRVLHFDGTAWSRQSTDATATLHAVWGAPTGEVFAVGDAGTIIHLAVPHESPSAGACGDFVELSCGATLRGSTTAHSADLADHAACSGAPAAPGPELVYRLRPQVDGAVNLAVSNTTGPLHLHVYAADSDNGCDLERCLLSAVFDVALQSAQTLVLPEPTAGDTYFIVVDGPSADGVAFTLHSTCLPPQ